MQLVFLSYFLQYQKKEDGERLQGGGGRTGVDEGDATHHYYLTFLLFSVLSMTVPFAYVGEQNLFFLLLIMWLESSNSGISALILYWIFHLTAAAVFQSSI